MTRIVAAVVGLLFLVVAAGPARAAVTVGVADLDQWTPNLSVGCSQEPYFGFPTNASTCTYYTTSSVFLSMQGTNIVPKGYGVITKVRVKTADVPQGPMQVVTFRSIRQSNSTGIPGCCWPQYATATFTPQRGTTTEIKTQLPVMKATLLQQFVNSGDIYYEPLPDDVPWIGAHEVPAGVQGIENFDQIGLTVLDPSTPIPATFTGNAQGPAGAAFFPGLTDHSLRTDVAGLNGVQVLLQAVWEPDADADGYGDETQDPDGGRPAATAGGPTGGAPTQPTTEQAPVTLPTLARVTRRGTRVALVCRMTTTCAGRLRLMDRAQGTATAAASAKPRVYGSARFSIPAGQTRRIEVKLSRTAKSKLRKRGKLVVFANATVGNRIVSSKLTLRRAR